MSSYENLYCKLFIDTDLSENSILVLVASILSGSINRWSVVTELSEIYVNKNDYFDMERRSEKQEGFLYSRYYLDIEPKENADEDNYINSISNLLQGLWTSGLKAVAACDFEEELPKKGGYCHDNLG